MTNIIYLIEILYPLLKLVGLVVMCWLVVEKRDGTSLWLFSAMVSVVLVDIIGLFFATEVYVVELQRVAKTYAYDVQRTLYVLHYLFLVFAGISLTKSKRKTAGE